MREGILCSRWNSKIHSLYKDRNIVGDMKIRRPGEAGHLLRRERERIPEKNSSWEIPHCKISRKTKNSMGGRRPEGCITVAMSSRNDMRIEKSGGAF